MKIERLTGKAIAERQRWAGDPFDTLIVLISCDDGEEYSVKMKEASWGFELGVEYTWWGNWSSYKNKRSGRMERQLSAFCYYHAYRADQVQDMMELLLGRRFPRDLAASVVDEFGDNARKIVETNPYSLGRFPRVGFKLCDRLYCELGKPVDRLKRQTLCAAYALQEDGSGSVWHPFSRVETAIAQSIDGFEGDTQKAVRLGVRAGVLDVMYTDGLEGQPTWDGTYKWVASSKEAQLERDLAGFIQEFSAMPNRWPEIPLWDEGEHQHEQLMRSLEGPVGILLGSAGTGKTFTAAKVIEAVRDAKKSFAIIAPTGKAAVRLTEALAEIGVNERAVTAHSKMGFDGVAFRRSISEEFLFVDEASMVDLSLMTAIFSRCEPGTHILFIGDPYQLPPVGSGAPLRDMMELVPTGTLTQVRRNSGAIVRAGTMIRNGERFDVCRVLNEHEGDNLIWIPASSPDAVTQKCLGVYDQLVERFGLDPLWQLQVFSIVNARSRLGCHELNRVLQQHLNKDSQPVAGTPFRVGDKVMQTKNSWMLPFRGRGEFIHSDAIVHPETGLVYCANGEMGKVLAIDEKVMRIEMVAPKRIVLSYKVDVSEESDEGLTGSSYQLAYAITTHKSQGSQIPFGIFMLDDYPGARRLFDQSLLYTAITRAKRATFLIGDIELAQAAASRANIWSRKTFLREICRGQA